MCMLVDKCGMAYTGGEGKGIVLWKGIGTHVHVHHFFHFPQ